MPRAGGPSVVKRLGIWIAAIALLAGLSILSSITVVELSSGEARAINMAGSLRMHSYAIQSAAGLAASGASTNRVREAVNEFEARYAHPDLVRAIPERSTDPVRIAYQAVGDFWRSQFRPLALQSLADPARRSSILQADTTTMVAHIDNLVALIEEGLETKLQRLRLAQGMSLALLLIVGGCTVAQLKIHVITPLGELLSLARVVRTGDFQRRMQPREADELGQLGEAFNFMIEDLSRIYAELESRVAEKTAELARSNQSLDLLYRTTHALSEKAVSREILQHVLKDVIGVIGLESGVLCLQQDDAPAMAIPTEDAYIGTEAASCPGDPPDSEDITPLSSEVGAAPSSSKAWTLSIPLYDGLRRHGMMHLSQPAGSRLENWQMELLETVGRHIGAALAARQRNEERHRLALLDERSVIARELHDSLAQSLSYLKIQVTRLQSLLGRHPPSAPVNEVVHELRDGLNEAYRQLRELLTTFRLRIDGRGLPAAIEDTVQEFRRRTGLQISLANHLARLELSPEREIHVLQIIREALSNIERHANARNVSIILQHATEDELTVMVDDDGVGFGQDDRPLHRYGLVIMRDRAASLHGTLQIHPRIEGGTCVEFHFPHHPELQDPSALSGGNP